MLENRVQKLFSSEENEQEPKTTERGAVKTGGGEVSGGGANSRLK